MKKVGILMKIGFIGMGNMGQAMLKGMLKAGLTAREDIFVYDVYAPIVEEMQNLYGITGAHSEVEVAKQVDVLILAIKPNMVENVLLAIKEVVLEKQIIVSIAATNSLAFLSKYLPEKTKIVRAMPNTPAIVGEGMSALCLNEWIDANDTATVLALFESFGKAKVINEALIDAFTGVSGSGPAYVYLFIEALADGGVALGLARKDAYEFAAQMVKGAAQMVLETGKHPGELKDMVTSPGGSTMAGIHSLENDRFRATVMNAVFATAAKNR